MWKRRAASVIALGALLGVSHGFQQQNPTTRLIPTTTSTRSPLRSLKSTQKIAYQKSSTCLSASPLVSIASSPLGAITVLAGIVLIHEAGHYLAAKSFSIAVEEFSVGVGPKILGFKAFGDEFSLRAIPLGGYVRFPENYNITMLQEMQEKAVEDAKAQAEPKDAGLGNKLVNLFSLGAVERKKREEEAAAQAEAEKLPWWKKLQDEEKLKVPEVEIPYYDDPKLLQNRPWQERAVVLSGGVVRSFVCDCE